MEERWDATVSAVCSSLAPPAVKTSLSPLFTTVTCPRFDSHSSPKRTAATFWAVAAACLLAIVYSTPLSRWLVAHTTIYWTRFLLFVPLALGYLVLTLPISLWSKQLEKKFRYAT